MFSTVHTLPAAFPPTCERGTSGESSFSNQHSSLPDMSGFEVLVTLVPRVRRPDMAVIILTNITLTEMATFALNSGAQAYLIKSRTSGEDLDGEVHKAIAAVGPHKNRER